MKAETGSLGKLELCSEGYRLALLEYLANIVIGVLQFYRFLAAAHAPLVTVLEVALIETPGIFQENLEQALR